MDGWEDSSILKYVCEGKKIEEDYGYESDAKAMLTVLELEQFDEKIKNLSGGQKKRAALCKVLLQKPDILILDEPTRGIDVGAKYDIYCLINKMVEEGKSVIMISSEMPELLGMCDRIYVMSEGRIAGEFTAEEATQERIMASIMQEQNKK